MDKHKIIMISGKQGSGKTSIMNNIILLAARQGINAMEVRFAETIYDIHDYIRNTLRFRGIERPEKDGRLLQLLGTEWGRQTIDPDIWVKATLGFLNNVAPVPNPKHLFVISDCRFRNEFDMVDAFKVRLEAPKDVRKARCDGWRDTDTHISETDLDAYASEGKFDLVIDTTTTKPEDVAVQILKEYNNGNFIRVCDSSSSDLCGDTVKEEQPVGEGEHSLEDQAIHLGVEGEAK